MALDEQKICLYLSEAQWNHKDEALKLAEHIGAFFTMDPDVLQNLSFYLCWDEEGLSLKSQDMKMRGDLSQNLRRIYPNRLSGEMLVKAAKPSLFGENPFAIDATAGMGEDALLLAAAGCEVWLYEQNPIIAALLRDSLQRAQKNPSLTAIVSRMRLIEGDSILAMRNWQTNFPGRPDIVLLDPMFPERRKSALVKKKFQLLHLIERPCDREEDLLQAAMMVRPRRLLIKRPLKSPYLAGVSPSYSLEGKAIRYDCIIFASEPE